MFDVKKTNNDLSLLSPFFRAKLKMALKDVWAAGYDLFVFEGWRSPSRQDYLYEQGRTSDGKIITNAKRWTSWHQYGVACDLVFKINNRWTWEPSYDKAADIMKNHGFEWGGDFKSFKDIPHFQITGGLTIQEAKAITEQHGVQALWIEIDGRKKSLLS